VMAVAAAGYFHRTATIRPVVAIAFGSDSGFGFDSHSIHRTRKMSAEVVRYW